MLEVEVEELVEVQLQRARLTLQAMEVPHIWSHHLKFSVER